MVCLSDFNTKHLLNVPIPHGNDLVKFMGKMPVTGYTNDFINQDLNGPEVLANGARLLNNAIARDDAAVSAAGAAKPTADKTEGDSSSQE